MLKRRILILAVLVATLIPLSSNGNQKMTEDCVSGRDAFGNCILICCDPHFGCYATICP